MKTNFDVAIRMELKKLTNGIRMKRFSVLIVISIRTGDIMQEICITVTEESSAIITELILSKLASG